MKYYFAVVLSIAFCTISRAELQSDLQKKFLGETHEKILKFSERRKKAIEKYLSRFNKCEEKFLRKLCLKDSRKADALFKSWAQAQRQLNKNLCNQDVNHTEKQTAIYNAHNDTLFNMLEYIGDSGTIAALNEYKMQLNKEGQIKDYMRKQKFSLKKEEIEFPELKGSYKDIDKNSYYLVQQLYDYDSWFNKTDAMERTVVESLKSNFEFSKYMEVNSDLSSFSIIPSSWGKKIDGLQSNSMVKAAQQQSLKGLSEEGREAIKEKLTESASQISKMKFDFPQLTNAADLPEFKPNPLKTKRRVDRLHRSFDFQLDNHNSFVPKGITTGVGVEYNLFTSTDIGVGIGYYAPFYKVSGENRNRQPSSIALRGNVDYKLKSVLFLTGCYEKRSSQNPTRIFSASQKSNESMLVGLKLKHPLKNKLTPTISLMYDFLYEKHVPKTQMIVYRFGWGF